MDELAEKFYETFGKTIALRILWSTWKVLDAHLLAVFAHFMAEIW